MSADRLNAKNMFRNTVLFGAALTLMAISCLMTVVSNAWDENAACTMFAANAVLNAAIFLDLFRNIRRDFPLLVFTLSYDLLLCGRVYSVFIRNYDKVLSYLEADSFYNLYLALAIVTMALLAVYTAYRLAAPLFLKREKAIGEKGWGAVTQGPLVPMIRQISVVVLFFSSAAFFYVLFQTVLYVFEHGYLGSYIMKAESSVPSVISRMSGFFAPSFAVFLATLPSKKQMRVPLVLYGAYMLTSLFTGRRNTFVCEALMLAVYFVLRTALAKKEKRMPRKKVWLLVIACVAGAYVLQVMATVRSGSGLQLTGFFSSIANFIYSQGASFRVVIQTVNCWNRFDHQTAYQFLFYPLEKYANNNSLLRSVFGFSPIVEVQNIPFVSTTHNFAHVITFMVDPTRYLSGGGFGTSFVAEAYVAFGMAGVVVVSAMIGVMFRFFSSMLTRNWVVLAMGLIALKDFVYIPRNFAFSWVIDVFSLTYLAYYIAVYFAALFLTWFGSHIRAPRAALLGEREESA